MANSCNLVQNMNERDETAALHPLQKLIQCRLAGEIVGMPSYCTANEFVLAVILEHARKTGKPVLIEATANQVNQFGGYTKMTPNDFKKLVDNIAKKVNLPRKQLILAGDHLGPLVWATEPSEAAMEKAKDLVRLFVLAGFTKIHLDTSMKLGGDDENKKLSTEIIARRGVALYQTCMTAFYELKKKCPKATRPVFVIGSEVPIPGGSEGAEDIVSITKPEDFLETIETYQHIFREEGLENAWEDIVATVAQPGVEFGDAQIFQYNRFLAQPLLHMLDRYPRMLLEGHSTDYQTRESLKAMVEDKIAILKVGPALTFSFREALFSLSMIEKELIPEWKQAFFMEQLEAYMTEDPKNWERHYHGSAKDKLIARRYSFSDRCRYYMNKKEILSSIEALLENLDKTDIPLSVLKQYMPLQYEMVVHGQISNNPRALVKAGILACVSDYEYAAGYVSI